MRLRNSVIWRELFTFGQARHQCNLRLAFELLCCPHRPSWSTGQMVRRWPWSVVTNSVLPRTPIASTRSAMVQRPGEDQRPSTQPRLLCAWMTFDRTLSMNWVSGSALVRESVHGVLASSIGPWKQVGFLSNRFISNTKLLTVVCMYVRMYLVPYIAPL